ncbi:hypothetical protein D3C72_2276440 [compost metagenome]
MRLVGEVERQRFCHRLQHLGDLGRHNARDVLAGDVLAIALRRQGAGDAHRGLDAEIGLDQQVFEFLQRVFIQLALGEQRGDLACQLR